MTKITAQQGCDPVQKLVVGGAIPIQPQQEQAAQFVLGCSHVASSLHAGPRLQRRKKLFFLPAL